MADRYDTESAMYPILFDHLRDQGGFVCTQVPVRSYRADFMSFEVDWEIVKRRLRYGLYESISSASQWRMLVAVQKDPSIAYGDLAERLSIGRGYARSLLRDLEGRGVVEVTGDNVRIAFWPEPVFRRVKVVEAKLSDWKRAILQAVRYTHCATDLYVAVPQRLAENLASDMPEKVQRTGVGIMSVNSAVQVVVPSREFGSARFPVELHQLSEHVWSRLMLTLRRLPDGERHEGWLPIRPGSVPTDLPAGVL